MTQGASTQNSQHLTQGASPLHDQPFTQIASIQPSKIATTLEENSCLFNTFDHPMTPDDSTQHSPSLGIALGESFSQKSSSTSNISITQTVPSKYISIDIFEEFKKDYDQKYKDFIENQNKKINTLRSELNQDHVFFEGQDFLELNSSTPSRYALKIVDILFENMEQFVFTENLNLRTDKIICDQEKLKLLKGKLKKLISYLNLSLTQFILKLRYKKSLKLNH